MRWRLQRARGALNSRLEKLGRSEPLRVVPGYITAEMDKKKKAPSHDEIWDDSLLVDSWNEALEEYKVCC